MQRDNRYCTRLWSRTAWSAPNCLFAPALRTPPPGKEVLNNETHPHHRVRCAGMRRDRMGWLPRRIAFRCAALEVRSRRAATLSRGARLLLAAQRLEFFSSEEAMDQKRQLRSILT